MNTKGQIAELIIEAEKIGLPEDDIANARKYLEYNENGLALDTILTQLHEYDIPITESFYQKAERIAKAMKLPVSEYSYIKVLIK